MNMVTLLSTFIAIIGTISSIYFAYVAYKKNNDNKCISEGKESGVVLTNINYIKECLDRVEKNINNVDERSRAISIRLVKTEEALVNVTKRVDEMYKFNGP